MVLINLAISVDIKNELQSKLQKIFKNKSLLFGLFGKGNIKSAFLQSHRLFLKLMFCFIYNSFNIYHRIFLFQLRSEIKQAVFHIVKNI